MTRLLVGMPVFRRGWILPLWFGGVESAAREAGLIPSYIFVGDPHDRDSFDVIDEFLESVDREAYVSWVEEYPDTPVNRVWNHKRYHRMVYIRNELLTVVRNIGPEYFLSLDSDIILHPKALVNMFESIERFDAVGGKTYMTPHGRNFPSYGMLPGLKRVDDSGVFEVDVIMAIKLMTPEAYSIDYKFDSRGEDIGFSISCKDAGLHLGWDGRVVSRHIMSRDDLEKVDERCV